MRPRAALLAAFTASAGCLLAAAPARAQDGAYGRFSGDVALGLEGGYAVGTPRGFASQARALYLATAGVYGSLFAPPQGSPEGTPVSWSAGVELRPLFLGRFLNALEKGPSTLDLTLDSISLGMGGRFAGSRKGALELTAGLELPLMGSYEGLFLGARVFRLLPHERLVGDTDAGSTQVLFTFGFRLVATSHAVDVGDELRR